MSQISESTAHLNAALKSPSEKHPAASTVDLIDVHSLHKSGTMFLFKFFRELSVQRNMAFLSENHSPADDYSAFDQLMAGEKGLQRICRAPIRTFDLQGTRVCDDRIRQKRIFHLRDPRDMLVSEYYSFGWIHPTEQTPLASRRNEIQQMSVDEYVVTQSEVCTWPIDQKYRPLEDYEFDLENELVVTYEQMVTAFPKWCGAIVSFLDLSRPRWLMTKLAWKYRNEFKASNERMTHKRRITPGDHREKLKASSIKVLNDRFEKVLKRFGYLT